MIKINGRLFKLEYEGIGLVCFVCGCVGHRRENCPSIKAKEYNGEGEGARGGGASSYAKLGEEELNSKAGIRTGERKEDSASSKVEEFRHHGEWMVVSDRWRQRGRLREMGHCGGNLQRAFRDGMGKDGGEGNRDGEDERGRRTAAAAVRAELPRVGQRMGERGQGGDDKRRVASSLGRSNAPNNQRNGMGRVGRIFASGLGNSTAQKNNELDLVGQGTGPIPKAYLEFIPSFVNGGLGREIGLGSRGSSSASMGASVASPELAMEAGIRRRKAALRQGREKLGKGAKAGARRKRR